MITGVRSGWVGDRSKNLHRHAMEMEQIMARLLTDIKTETRINKGKTDATLKGIKTASNT
jgi:hypothetical protein